MICIAFINRLNCVFENKISSFSPDNVLKEKRNQIFLNDKPLDKNVIRSYIKVHFFIV